MKLRVRGKLIDEKQVLGESDYLIRISLVRDIMRWETSFTKFFYSCAM